MMMRVFLSSPERLTIGQFLKILCQTSYLCFFSIHKGNWEFSKYESMFKPNKKGSTPFLGLKLLKQCKTYRTNVIFMIQQAFHAIHYTLQYGHPICVRWVLFISHFPIRVVNLFILTSMILYKKQTEDRW